MPGLWFKNKTASYASSSCPLQQSPIFSSQSFCLEFHLYNEMRDCCPLSSGAVEAQPQSQRKLTDLWPISPSVAHLPMKMRTHPEVAAMVLRANVPQFSGQRKGWCPITSGGLKIKCFAIHYWHFSKVEESANNSYHRGPQDTYTRQADLLVVSEQV